MMQNFIMVPTLVSSFISLKISASERRERRCDYCLRFFVHSIRLIESFLTVVSDFNLEQWKFWFAACRWKWKIWSMFWRWFWTRRLAKARLKTSLIRSIDRGDWEDHFAALFTSIRPLEAEILSIAIVGFWTVVGGRRVRSCEKRDGAVSRNYL